MKSERRAGKKAVVDYQELKLGGFLRQKQKNRFSLRLKVVGGKVTAEQLSVISSVAKKYGKGYVHLTSRQSVEIPFIKVEDIDLVRAELRAGGVYPGACGPMVRTVTACQGDAVCSSGCIDTYGLAKALSRRYADRLLPHKFKIGVTGCRNNCLKAEENDLGIRGGYQVDSCDKGACVGCGACAKVCRTGAITIKDKNVLLDTGQCNHCGRCVKACGFKALKGRGGYVLSFGGTFGNRIASGKEILPILLDKKLVFLAADAVLDFFDAHGTPGKRLRDVIEQVGWDIFEQAVNAAVDA